MNSERKRWYMALEIRLAQPAHETADTKNNNVTDNTLTELGKCVVIVRNVWYQPKLLVEAELRFIHNHFQTVQMTDLRWKRKVEIPRQLITA
jgi:hypothetical protein